MKIRYCCIFLPLLMLVGCRATKYVPDNAYLLNKVSIKVSDDKQFSHDELKTYLRQTPNSSVLGLWKMQLGIYNMSGPDTTKWINRTLRKMGEAPEIYDSTLTVISCTQLTRFMENKGYFDAQVSSSIATKKQKVKLTYQIEPNKPYRLKSYRVNVEHADLKRIAKDTTRSSVRTNMLFDSDVLNDERNRIAQRMRNNGYYYFQKDYLTYTADSTFNTHQVELELQLRDYILNAPDSISELIFTKYRIANVNFYTDYDPTATEVDTAQIDTMRVGNYFISYGGKRYLRPNTLINNCYIIPGELYNERTVERTYSSLNALGPIKYVNVSFQQISADELVCHIVVSKSKLKSFSIEAEGTYSAGDLGVAGNVGYVHRNLFHGAEELSIKGRGAYEWRQKSGVAIEWSADASLKFPSFLMPLSRDFRRKVRASTIFNISYNYQKRPEEYTRTIASAGIQYAWAARRSPWRHTFDLLDLSYVYLPTISDAFKAHFMNDQSILKYSYENHFIMRWGYSGSYSNFNANRPLRNYRTIQYGIETAGNLLYGINKMAKSEPDEDGSYKIFNIRYSQYVKTDVAITYHQIFDASNRLVYHAAFGLAVPYGNASSIPFEKRYFAGGANSVRGWSVRSLGPGSYMSHGGRIDFNNQCGDIKLDLNLEYRTKLFWLIEAALFLDAGNIWTIREYDTQPGGAFKFDSFYKQIAIGYGAGLRLDFTFFVFRVDFGVKLFDPSYARQNQWRTKPTWKDDMAFHFAIGYPF